MTRTSATPHRTNRALAAALGLALALSVGACGDDTKPGTTDTSDATTSDADAGDTTIPDSVGDTTGDSSEPTDTLTDGTGPTDTTNPGDTDTIEPPQGCEAAIPAAPSGQVCGVVAGTNDAALLIRGDVVLPEGILEKGQVLVVNGFVACTGCDCDTRAEAAGATVFNCPEGLVSPGLINAHDHITYTQDDPIPHGTTRWNHRHEWRTGANGRPELTGSPQNSDSLGDAWGEMRQVMAGTTSLFGSGAERGFLRNLDRANYLERVSHDDATYDTFPLGDSNGRITSSGCGNYSLPSQSDLAGTAAYVPHVSEGVIQGARNEYQCMADLEDGAVDMLADNFSMIHGIGLTTADIALAAGEGVGLVWSPRSNTDLYGFTAEAPTYHKLGAQIGLGTDWTPSGSVTMLRELLCAQTWNALWDDYFSDQQLVAMATSGSAAVLGWDDALGSLTAGRVADIAIWDARTNKGYRAILDATDKDVELTLRGGPPQTIGGNTYFRRGTPLYGAPELVDALSDRPLDYSKYDHSTWPTAASLPAPCESLDVCGATKKICVAEQLEGPVSSGSSTYTTISLADMRARLEPTSYDLFFCGVPTNEPSCTPFRPGEFTGVPSAGDADGDGIADAVDNCPNVFNAIRPMDGTSQPNVDGDGLGDACDPCPFDADTTACTSVNPDDIDGDGFFNATDNCPSIPNEDQADGDNDGIGDLCDACPTFSNLGGLPCPASVWAVKKREVTVGTQVLLQGLIVTAVGSNFFTAQADPAADGYEGVGYSAIYAFTGSDSRPAIGDTVDVAGTVADYFGEIELEGVTWTKKTPGSASVIEPTVVPPASVAKGGADAEKYEAVLVKVTNVAVTKALSDAETGETVVNEFTVTGGLTVDDQIYLIDPQPAVGQNFASITGILRYTWNRDKLLPRMASDVVYGAPVLASVGPELAYVYVGETSDDALTLTLTSPATEALTVTLSSGSAAATVPASVTFAVGEQTKSVAVTGVSENEDVTITAVAGDVTVMAHVRVLPAGYVPVPMSLEPDTETVTVGGDVTFTLKLDAPAPAGGATATVTATGEVAAGAPTSVAFAAGEQEKTFVVTAGAAAGTMNVEVTVGGESLDADVTVSEVALVGLVLAEVFYDADTGSAGDDNLEWIMLYNGSGAALDLSGYSLGWGGTNYTYGKQQLSGTVAAGACFIVGGPTSSAANYSPVFDLAANLGGSSNDIQNGAAPGDGVALFHVAASAITATTQPIDAVVYGDNNNSNLISADGAAHPPNVADAPAGMSIRRVTSTSWEVSTPTSPPTCPIITQ
ncbi:MAG: thrombospondin type 3 repeat-containing protein [Myxococcales bacterium]|nr:thrombospondin type 3 repeat-containing protein [Myxococcales bacterium]MCB9731075.1 thrombospondin type 3 repeat-containing protein [Deltaproteobacteria bacterium]